MTTDFVPPLTYEIGDETLHKRVTELRDLPDTVNWGEIDSLRHEEELKGIIATRGLPPTTTWEEFRRSDRAEGDKYLLEKEAAYKIRSEEQRVLTAVGLGLDEGASWDKIGKAYNRPLLAERLQRARLEALIKIGDEIQELRQLCRLPDTRSPTPDFLFE